MKARKNPGVKQKARPDHKAQHQEEAIARQKKSDLLTVEDRIAMLNIKFGPGQGAKKERARLAASLLPKLEKAEPAKETNTQQTKTSPSSSDRTDKTDRADKKRPYMASKKPEDVLPSKPSQ